MIINYILLMILFPLLIYFRTKDKYHPLICFSFLWYFFAGISSLEVLYNEKFQHIWSLETHINIIFSGVFMLLPSLIFGKIKRKINKRKIDFNSFNYRLLLNIFLVIGFCSFLLRFSSNRLIPTIFLEKSGDLKELVPESLVILHYIENSLPYFSVICIFELLYSQKINRFRQKYLLFWIFFINVIYSLMYCLSRGNLVIVIFGGLYLYILKKEISYKKIFLFIAIIVLFLIIFTNLRMNNESFLTTAFQKYGKDSNLLKILSGFYIYFSYSFENFRKLVESSTDMTYYKASLKFLIYPLNKYWYQTNEEIRHYETLFLNAKPYIYYFYHDLRFIGIAIYNLLIGNYIMILVNKSYINEVEVCKIALLQKFLIFAVLGNNFFGETIIFVSYFFCFMILNTIKKGEKC